MNIIQDFIAPGRRNRPTTNPNSSRYKIIIPPKWITIHNAWSPWDARGLNNYQQGDDAASRPASWHLSVSDGIVVKGVPFGETAWHAGDYVSVSNPGLGNTQSIGIEICDFYNSTTKRNDQEKYLLAEAYSVLLVAYLIKTIPSLLPFPECVVPHTKWRPASGCPSRILGRKDGWETYINQIREVLINKPEQPNPPAGLPVIQREIGIELDGLKVDEKGYLIDNRTYVRASWLLGVAGNIKITGHGDHIKVSRRGL